MTEVKRLRLMVVKQHMFVWQPGAPSPDRPELWNAKAGARNHQSKGRHALHWGLFCKLARDRFEKIDSSCRLITGTAVASLNHTAAAAELPRHVCPGRSLTSGRVSGNANRTQLPSIIILLLWSTIRRTSTSCTPGLLAGCMVD